MAPSLVNADDDGNVKIHSSPLQRMGSALHTDMCHCHGVPGIASGRAGGHGCQERNGDTGQTRPFLQPARFLLPGKKMWWGSCNGLTRVACWNRGTHTGEEGSGECVKCV